MEPSPLSIPERQQQVCSLLAQWLDRIPGPRQKIAAAAGLNTAFFDQLLRENRTEKLLELTPDACRKLGRALHRSPQDIEQLQTLVSPLLQESQSHRHRLLLECSTLGEFVKLAITQTPIKSTTQLGYDLMARWEQNGQIINQTISASGFVGQFAKSLKSNEFPAYMPLPAIKRDLVQMMELKGDIRGKFESLCDSCTQQEQSRYRHGTASTHRR